MKKKNVLIKMRKIGLLLALVLISLAACGNEADQIIDTKRPDPPSNETDQIIDIKLPDLPSKDMVSEDEYGEWIGNQGIWLDKCNDEKLSKTLQVLMIDYAAARIDLSGWAGDFCSIAPFQTLYLQVGDHVLECDYGLSRTGVANHFGQESFTNIGFQTSFPVSYLQNGAVKEISFIGVSSDGKNLYTPVTYRLAYLSNKLPDLPSKDMVSADEYGDWIGNQGIYLDKYNGKKPENNLEIAIDPKSDVVDLYGWAVDFGNNASFQALYLQIDDYLLECEYGIDRAGVANRFGYDAMSKCGFKITFPASYLQNGDVKEISFIGVSADGQYLYSPVIYRLTGA